MAPVDLESVAAVSQIVSRLRDGELTGAICITFDGEEFNVVMAGSARTQPTLTLGALACVKMQLAQAILNQSSSLTEPRAQRA
jgi:hypothetical protein